MLHFLLSFCKSTLIDIESTTTHSYFYPINRMMKFSLLLILNSLKSHLTLFGPGGAHCAPPVTYLRISVQIRVVAH